MTENKTLQEKIDDFSNRFEDIIVDMQNVLIDIQLRNFEWEKKAKAKYEETEAYVNEVDSLITEIFSKGDLSSPQLMEKVTQFLVSYKPQIETFRNQIMESIKSPPEEFKFNDNVDESLEKAIKEMEENQKKIEEENERKSKEEEEESYEEEEEQRNIDEELQVKLAAEKLKKEFEEAQDQENNNNEEENQNENKVIENQENDQNDDSESSSDEKADAIRQFALNFPY